jgi:hypothetical protein
MKQKKFNKKLELKKQTIAGLEVLESGNAQGGFGATGAAGCPSYSPCIKTDYTICQTIEFTCTVFC